MVMIALTFTFIEKPLLYEKYNFSSVVYDRHGKPLKLSLSLDDKYRLFTPFEKISPTAVQTLLLYEDRAFYYHFGVNPLSLIRAIKDMTLGSRRQGASTITMQLARIVYNLDSSTVGGKISQILRALQIEIFYTKDEILEAYFNLAPYGGNIEGIGAASQIYFNKKAGYLSLAETISLIVIPQNPVKRTLLTKSGQQHNAKARQRLQKIWLSKYEHPENNYLNLPMAHGIYLPDEAPHFTRRILNHQHGTVVSTLDLNLQHLTESIVHDYIAHHQYQGISNATALIVNADNMDTLAYVGSNDFYSNAISGQVDGLKALRSPGSTLKPFIYALALEQGLIHPHSMLKDVPRNYHTYTPENFDSSFYGMVDATQALISSRNIPAVDLLQQIGTKNFYQLLQNSGVEKLKSAEYYGLAGALGGVEVSAENLATLYAMLYNNGNFQSLRFLQDEKLIKRRLLSPEASFLTLDMLRQNPPIDGITTYPLAWKTGTSYGFKDAWTAGLIGNYVIIVWIGNFDGATNNAFVGRQIATPLFFRLARQIAKHQPVNNQTKPDTSLKLAKVKICRDTGDIANIHCDKITDSYFIPGVSTIRFSNITRLIPIDVATSKRTCRHRPPRTQMQAYNFWPSDVLKAYSDAGINIRRPPEFGENCHTVDTAYLGKVPTITAPADGTTILVHSQQQNSQKIALKATTDADASEIYWFLNHKLAGTSKTGEILTATSPVGLINITAVDDLGRSTNAQINVRYVD